MMNDTEHIQKLQCELEKVHCMNKELQCKLQKYETANFQIVTREEAVLSVMNDKKVKAYQVDVSQDYVGSVSGITVDDLNDDFDTFYIIQKGKVKP